MIETKTRQIDGHMIESTQFPARRAFKYQTRLIRLLSPLGALLGKANKQSMVDQEIDFSKLTLFADALDDENTMNFLMILLSYTRVDDKEITNELFDMEFAGRLDLVYKILFFVLEVNFSSFLAQGNIGEILSGLGVKLPEKNEKVNK